MSESDAAIVVTESRRKVLLLWIASAAFVATGVWMIQDPSVKRLDAWGGLTFFGLCLAVSTLLLIRPAVLILSPEGFRVQMLWRNTLTRWDEVSDFRIWSPRGNVRFVAFDYAPGHRQGLRGVLGYGSLPGNWTMSPLDLLALMSNCKARWDVKAAIPSGC